MDDQEQASRLEKIKSLQEEFCALKDECAKNSKSMPFGEKLEWIVRTRHRLMHSFSEFDETLDEAADCWVNLEYYREIEILPDKYKAIIGNGLPDELRTLTYDIPIRLIENRQEWKDEVWAGVSAVLQVAIRGYPDPQQEGCTMTFLERPEMAE